MNNKIIETSLVLLVPGLIVFVILMEILPDNSKLILFGIVSSMIISLTVYVHRLPNPSPETIFPDGAEFKIQKVGSV